MFSGLKDRALEKIRNLGPQDELDKAITGLVDMGTVETLQGPHWSANMELVDLVNRSPEVACDKVCRILNRTISKPVVRTQVLALTMLDTCVRNCHPLLHSQLAQSVLWADLLKLVQDKSVTRIDLEVRDKILTMIEDYGKYLKTPPTFAETYESLVDQGVDFPVRSPDDIVPIEVMTPPPPPLLPDGTPAPAAAATAGAASLFANLLSGFAGPAAPGGAAGAGAAGAAAPGAAATGVPAPAGARGGARARGGGVDPAVLEGLSEEDRMAVQAAMAEMALEMESAQEAAAIAASLQTAAAAGGDPFTPQLPTSTSASLNTSPAVALPPGTTGAGSPAVTRAPGPPPLPEANADALLVITNSIGVFSDLVGGMSEADPAGVRDPLIRDLAEQCSGYRSRLAQMAQEISDEALLIAALNQNDILGTVLARYDDLVAQAMSLGPLPTSPATDTAARAAAAASAISAGGAGPAESAGPNFTLLDDDDEEDGEDLATRRHKDASPPPSAAPSRPRPLQSPPYPRPHPL